jgi:aldose 1-epimerase
MALDHDTVSGGPPSGRQYTIAYGDHRAHVTQVGATLRSYTYDGHDVIDGFAIAERATDGRGQVLAPWPNRLSHGRYTFGRHDCQAPLNEPSRNNAIHGLVRWLDWSPVTHEEDSVTLSCAVRPQPGFEWQLDLQVTYELDDAGLTVTLEASNGDSDRAPFGAGFHPYLTLGTPAIDSLHLTIPAAGHLDAGAPDEQPAPVPVDDRGLDFRRSRQLGGAQLDDCFGDLIRGDDGRAVARLDDPHGGRSVELWVDDAYRYLMVYSSDQVGRPERRRTAVAIEPMTCPPNALRSGTDLVELEPGQSWQGAWGIRPTSPGH